MASGIAFFIEIFLYNINNLDILAEKNRLIILSLISIHTKVHGWAKYGLVAIPAFSGHLYKRFQFVADKKNMKCELLYEIENKII